MQALDLAVLGVYLGGTILFGAWCGRGQRTAHDYFVSGHRVPWWAVMGSIVATETSTVTFISVPGFAYGNNLTFLQLAFGYFLGRIVVSVLFVPAYFRGELLTVYQLLGQRFGTSVRRFASGLFLVTRTLADGFRLFATGLVLAALLSSSPAAKGWFATALPGVSPALSPIVISVLLVGAATMAYTFWGGMTAVIWTDVLQLTVYVGGAAVAACLLLAQIPGGWAEVVSVGKEAGRFRVFDFTWDLTRGYTFWSGVVGGLFLTTATHGTDQLMVQRYLCSRSSREARAALLTSGIVIILQFLLFLLIGVMLYVYYSQHAVSEIAAFTVNGRVQTDRIFPAFIVTHLPPGIVGLVCAAALAAAMSTLSSSLNSSAAATIGDFYMPFISGNRSEAHYLTASRLATFGWGLLQMIVALVAIDLSSRVVDEVLGIASFTNGIILGIFLLGSLTPFVRQRAAFTGVAAGAAVMLWVRLGSGVSWQWYVLIGSLATVLVGILASKLGADAD